ncbi:MAG TPA: class I SAM-dependent methyltransferase [Conexibacter sp.]|nr:class I SAM-dependent methyltransferase [Conexibacter sp.]
MAMSFPIAPPASAEKLRGGYYTPGEIAAFLAEWVAGAGPRILEPSCGDGAILSALPTTGSVVGIELEETEAAKAQVAAPAAEVIVSDFFEWYSPEQDEAWDGVAGNPPFIRFGNWTEPTRGLALDVMRRVGMRPTKLTNAWVPFIVASALAVRRGGRIGLVVPAEVMQVNYASELRGFLVDEFSELTVVTFRRLVFHGVLQEVVLILGERGQGPARIKVVEVADASRLPTPAALTALDHAPALRHETEKWTKYFLDLAEIEALRTARELKSLTRLGTIAQVDVGVVTGRNRFFVLRPSGSIAHGVTDHVIPLVSKSAHLQGIEFKELDLDALRESDAACELLSIDDALDPHDDTELSTYVLAGEAENVHTGFKCSIRRQWWVVPSVWTPDAFLLRQIYDHPRVIANKTGATSTDTIHRVRMANGTPPIKLAAASINSVTFAFSEVMGRSYGGGVLELEPREAEGLPFPDPRLLTSADCKKIDRHLRNGQLTEALDYVDQVLLVDKLDVESELVEQLRGVWERLRDRRLARSRSFRQ